MQKSRGLNRVAFMVLAAVALCGILSINARAENAYYPLNAETDFTVEGGVITGYTGDKTIAKEIVVPQTIGGVEITGIGKTAFADCTALETVAIPDTVTSIDSQAFARDMCLNYVIAYTAGDLDGNTVVRQIDSVTELPSKIATIAADAFLSCERLQKFRVKNDNTAFKTYTEAVDNSQSAEEQETLKNYNEGEFLLSKDGLTVVRYAPGNHVNGDIHIPSGVTTIGSYSFESADSTNGVVIPSTVTTINDYGFYGYRTSLIITFEEPAALATIGAFGFSHLNIFDIKLPATVTSIGDYCFSDIKNIHQLDVSGSNLTVIPAYAFANNADMHELTMPATLKEIKGYAFSGSVNLDTVKFLGETLEKIESHTFEGCRTLHEIEIPDGVTAIEDSTFSGCSNLGKVILPDSVTVIGDNAFKDCVTIHEMVIPANVTYISENSFEGARTDLIDTSKSDAAQRVIATANLNKGSFVYINDLKYRLLEDPVDGKAKVALAAAKEPAKLKKVTVYNSLTYSVGDKNFEFTVTAVDDKALANCPKLKTVTIGKNVTAIGKKAFFGDKKLKKLTINSKKLKKIGKQAFKKTKGSLKIKVPVKKKAKYKKLLKKAGFKGKLI